ncbi:hypothetical protein KEM54_005812 [Ascosphaera aggregata]|nr:hypothetical protein KEM54_005812 [Ascosphaera aggregata]
MGAQTVRQRTLPKQSHQTAINEQLERMTREDFNDDLCLLPGTFIRPVWSNLPSFFKDPKGRMKMEWQWLRSRALNLFGLAAYFIYLRGCFNEPLYRRFLGRKQAAKELHKKMYTALANGNRTAIERICCAGLRNNLTRRIDKRGDKSDPYVWELHGYINFPRSLQIRGGTIVSDRGSSLQFIKNMGVRQVIVRIQSKQSLEKPLPTDNGGRVRKDENGKAAVTAADSTERKIQDCTEYVVLQKFVFKGKEDAEWKVWGLAQETTLEVLEKDPYFAPGLPLKEKISSMTDRLL